MHVQVYMCHGVPVPVSGQLQRLVLFSYHVDPRVKTQIIRLDKRSGSSWPHRFTGPEPIYSKPETSCR